MAIKCSFRPIVDLNSRYLILGSLPGDLSLEKQEYYGHPQNRFWRLLGMIFQEDIMLDYADKKRFLLKHHIAVWDVCGTAFRVGSMDTAIQEAVPNDILDLLKQNPGIEHVLFNGKKAMHLYDRFFERIDGVQYHELPSTSPANASYNLEKLYEKWVKVFI
ncbi:DNA-deoxyinosine glycosylase [Sphingobacterium sp. CZ-2]|uniref:DNA-deoxyinosine glycosylase n=1 Tax=Sphingobacterium sp. CZ-2 TaxID=2557994 RepID=UPI00107005EE|nr:DNA-deoxyinosine glycosylase [Sphingobacterium sp. CZ-2]QBR12662.1 DNA-deoxyinosine glycosylase [Sphingobacterium sp. CZ-2]